MLEKIIKIVEEVIRENGKIANREIKEDTSLRKDLDFVSLDLAILTVKIEDEYDVDIFEEGIVDTVAEIVDKIKEGA